MAAAPRQVGLIPGRIWVLLNMYVSKLDTRQYMRVAASTFVMTAGLGLASLGAAAVAQADPAPFPVYHWCPGQWWDPGWGDNWDRGRCHDNHWYDMEARDQAHWHNGPWDDHWVGGYFHPQDTGDWH